MSIPVPLADLPATLTQFGSGYVLTTSGEAVKVVQVAPHLADDGRFRVPAPGRGTLLNASGHPRVTLLFPPLTAPDLCLLVDGRAEADGDDLLVTPTGAILHKPPRG